MKRWAITSLGLLVLLTLLAGFLHHPEHDHGHLWDKIPGFYILFGFAGCVLLIYFSKTLGKKALLKNDDYYDKMKS
jgi:hypothetical protein